MTSRTEPRLLRLPGLWLVFPTDPAAVRAVLQRCRTMVRASGPREIEIHAVWRRCVRIRFRSGQRDRKARLLKQLVAKQYRGILPRIRIRLA